MLSREPKFHEKNVQKCAKKCIFYLVKMKIFGILSRVVSRAIYESRKSQKKVFIFPDFDMNGHLPCGNRCTNFWDTHIFCGIFCDFLTF